MAIATSTAIIGSAIVGAGSAAYAGKQQKKASKKAAKAQTTATNKAAAREDAAAKENKDLQDRAFNETERRFTRQGALDRRDKRVSEGKRDKLTKQRLKTEEESQTRNTAQANRLLTRQRDITDQQVADFAPWRESGEKAVDQMWGDLQSGKFEIDASKYGLDSGNYEVDASKYGVDGRNYEVDGKDYMVDASQYSVDSEGFQVNADDYRVDADDFKMDDIDVTKDPGYKWRMEQGQRAQERSGAAKGMTMSGSQAMALQDYSQGLASQEYGVAYNREYDKKTQGYNREYGQQTDLYNREYDRQNNRYNRAWDSQTQGYNREAMQQNNLYSREYQRKSDGYNRAWNTQTQGYNREADRQNNRYGRDYQRQTDSYNREFDNNSRRLGILQGMSQQGLSAAGSTANARQNYSNRLAQRQNMYDGRVGQSQNRVASIELNRIDQQQRDIDRTNSNMDRNQAARINLPLNRAGIQGGIIQGNANRQANYSLAQGQIQADRANANAQANVGMVQGIAGSANQGVSNWMLNDRLNQNSGYNQSPGYNRGYNQRYA